MTEDKDKKTSKLDELVQSAQKDQLLDLIARARKAERIFRDKFYSIESEDDVVNNINEVIANCTPESRKQLQEFLMRYQGKSDIPLGAEDILEYIDTINIYKKRW